MIYRIEILKGLHPGFFIGWDIKERGMTKTSLSKETGITYSYICNLIKGKKLLTLDYSLRLEDELGYEEGFLMTLQIHYEIKLFQMKKGGTPNLSQFTEELFWDTDLENIDWQKAKQAVIERGMNVGNITDQAEIIRFYGEDEIAKYIRPTRKRKKI